MNTLQLQEFFVEGGDRKTSHALLHIAEPSTLEEKKKGYFFAVCEISQGEDSDIIALQNLIDEIENRYYETPEEEGENILENVLTKINHESYLLSNRGLDLHCMVGVLKQEEVFFSCHGQPLVYLFYRNKSGIYQKMNLVENNDNENESSHLFRQIVQGKISPNDFLFVATPHVGDYFNPDRLEKIISTRPIRQSAEHLERVLSELKNKISFGGLIIHLHQNAPEVIKKASPIIKGSSEKSLHNLFATEQKTASTLSSALIPNIGNQFKNLMKKEPTYVNEGIMQEEIVHTNAEINSNHTRQHQAKIHNEKGRQTDYVEITKKTIVVIFNIIKKVALAIWWIIILIINILHAILKFFVLLFLVITNIKNRRANIIDNWKRQINNFKTEIKHLPFVTKILLISTIILLIIFTFSILTIKSNQRKTSEANKFNQIVQEITTAKDAAESALIYKNETEALKELQKGKQLLSQLECKNKENVCADLELQLENLLVKIRKITIIKPELIADWSEQINELNKIAKINNKILALSADNNELLIYNLLTKEKFIIKIGEKLQALAVPKENDYALILSQNNSVWKFSPEDNSVKKAEISYPQNVKIQSIAIYNRRLYALDILNGKIYKHENIRDGFSLGTEWSKKDAEDLKNSFDLTIDGDIFVTQQNGQVDKYTKGEKQLFAVLGLDPTLNNEAEIWTYNDIEEIYILDKIEKRLIITNKSGQLQTQIKSDLWQKPNDLTVGENKKQVYILDQNKIFSFIIP